MKLLFAAAVLLLPACHVAAFAFSPPPMLVRSKILPTTPEKPMLPPMLRNPYPTRSQQVMSRRGKENDNDDKVDQDETEPTSLRKDEEEPPSAAQAWAAQQEAEAEMDAEAEAAPAAENADDDTISHTKKKKKKKYVVVGAGWGGWGAAKALCESGDHDVVIIDALPDPTGQTPYLSKSGKPVEAGTRGFWKDYPNINQLCAELGLDEKDVFTDFTNSSFYSPDGLEATAPVFSNTKFPELNLPFEVPFLNNLAGQAMPELPSPLGQVLATFPLFERIPLSDRASMIGLLVATVDCLGGDETVQGQYDRMTAHELFVRFGLSPRLVEDFIKPTLLVGLFKPPEELSALVVMELLYYYALAHMDSFDVRWIKNGTVADSLIAPLASRLVEKHDLKVLGGCRVGQVSLHQDSSGATTSRQKVSSVEYTRQDGTTETIQDVDGVVLALTCRGMQGVVSSSPDLARFPVFTQAASCKGIDVISVRLWLDRVVPTRTPANVFSRFSELRGAGGTFFMLDQLQKNDGQLWGEDSDSDSGYDDVTRGSVVACDFYNAGALLPLTDENIVDTLMNDLLPSAVAEFGNAQVVDSWVGRYPGAVSWFAPGTFEKRPPLQGAGRQVLPNLKCAGDWVRMGDREHGAKGLCQERAYVSGLEAANALLHDTIGSSSSSTAHTVLPVREDEAQFRAGIALNKQVMQFLPRFWVR